MTKKTVNKKQKPRMAIIIHVGEDGSVEVSGFPSHVGIATDIMTKALHRVYDYFITKAVEGKLKKDGTIEPNKIITPDKKIVTLH